MSAPIDRGPSFPISHKSLLSVPRETTRHFVGTTAKTIKRSASVTDRMAISIIDLA